MLEAGLEPIPGYRLTVPLGAGAFGEVWEARGADGRAVALKFIDGRSRARSLVRSELKVLRGLSELRHPHIIQFHGLHASAHYLILSMERADGNLAQLREAYQQEAGMNLPADHALELMEQAADALDFLAGVRLPGLSDSSRGLQHCDVKPGNLLLVGDTLKVADFGLCAATSWQGRRNAWRGTPPYAAPELYHGQAAAGTDQYALAVTFCELVMGERVFWKGQPLDRAPAGLPIDLTRLREREVPVFTRAFHPHPSARYPSCRAFVAALREAIRAHRTPLRLRRLRPSACGR